VITSFADDSRIIMQIQYYAISPTVTAPGGVPLYLTVESGDVVVDVQNGGDTQLWAAIQQFSPTANGLILINKAMYEQGEPCAIDAPNNNAPVVLEPIGSLVRGTWNFVYPAPGQIQVSAQPTMDLNVDGSTPIGPGSSVLAWPWSNGASNEVWTFTAVGQAVEVQVAASHTLA
jgi:hypothetical protein